MQVGTSKGKNTWMLTKMEAQLLVKVASKDVDRPYIDVVCFDAKRKTVVATDGHRLIRCVTENETVGEQEACIGRGEMETIVKLAKNGDTIMVEPNAKTAKVSIISHKHDTFTQEVKLRDKPFPDHEQVVPNDLDSREPTVPVGIDAKYLALAADLQRATGCASLKFYLGGQLDPIVIHSTSNFQSLGRWEYIVMPMRL